MEFTKEVKEFVKMAGADIVGITSVDHLQKVIPTKQKPLRLLSTGKSVIVYGVHILRGAMKSGDLRLIRYNAVEACTMSNEIGVRLAYFLESKGYDALIVHADLPVDFEKKGMFGDLSLRHIAAEAGLGEIGISTNFLCEEYGPRVYLGAVITSAELEPDKKKEKKLCLGEKCLLCMKNCPTGAIKGDGTKDNNLCLVEAMPFGLRKTLRHILNILMENDPKRRKELLYSIDTFNIWQALLTKLGVFGGCFKCIEVCPVGKKNYNI